MKIWQAIPAIGPFCVVLVTGLSSSHGAFGAKTYKPLFVTDKATLRSWNLNERAAPLPWANFVTWRKEVITMALSLSFGWSATL